MHSYSSIAAWKKLRFILSVKSDFHMTDSLSLALYAFASDVLMSVLIDETQLPGRWTCLRVSENYRFECDVTSLIEAHVFIIINMQ